jgi:glyoxylase-like metal-dependent hydrolase (beta-lactamase superfamily II)
MTDCITAIEYPGGVIAIDSGQVRARMASCYLAEADGEVAVIETGSNLSVPRILTVLEKRGWQRNQVRHVIVTHVHLDHAGGAGLLMQELPEAVLSVHPRGARHMIDPSRLESSARAVYGDETYDAMYGALIPIPAERVVVREDGDELTFGGRRLTFADTAGHARHHFCVWDETTRGWFTGDTFGLSYQDLKTANGPFVFPTSTPVQCDPPEWFRSIDKLMAREPDCIYATHFGRSTDTPKMAAQFNESLAAFVDIAERFRDSDDRTARIEEAMTAWLVGKLQVHGLGWTPETMAAWLEMDVRLNTQGLEFWLDHG